MLVLTIGRQWGITLIWETVYKCDLPAQWLSAGLLTIIRTCCQGITITELRSYANKVVVYKCVSFQSCIWYRSKSLVDMNDVLVGHSSKNTMISGELLFQKVLTLPSPLLHQSAPSTILVISSLPFPLTLLCCPFNKIIPWNTKPGWYFIICQNGRTAKSGKRAIYQQVRYS